MKDEIIQSTAELLGTCKAWICNHVVLSDDQVTLLAAWVLHTHAFDAARMTPYIHITAPDKESGKTLLMEVLNYITADGIHSANMTKAALVRMIASKRPVLFLDEIDTVFGQNANKEHSEAMRGILNEGYRKNGVIWQCTNPDDWEPKPFPVFSPKCLGGIGRLPDTLASRSIPIEMRRKLPGERVESLRERTAEETTRPIKQSLKQWATMETIEILSGIRPKDIAYLSDRQNDILEPLLAIAEIAGPEWLQRVSSAAQRVLGKANLEKEESIGTTLLEDIRYLFADLPDETGGYPSSSLVEELNHLEGHPWADWSGRRGLSTHQLARILRPYKIYPMKRRFGADTLQSYHRRDFEDSWLRYCRPK